MEADNKDILANYRAALQTYSELLEKAEKLANRISKILYDLLFEIRYIELEDDNNIYIFGTIFWGGSDEYVHFVIPLEWFILPEEKLVPAIDRWIHEYKKAQKQKEEEERKKRAEARRQEELAQLASLQEKYGKEAQ